MLKAEIPNERLMYILTLMTLRELAHIASFFCYPLQKKTKARTGVFVISC